MGEGIPGSSKEATNLVPDSLCELESKHDPNSDAVIESKSEDSLEWSPPATSSVEVEDCCKDSAQGRFSAEGSGCIRF